jgi:Do/DeqQ family serine protease
MLRRVLLATALLIAGFGAGLVVTGRTETARDAAEMSAAREAEQPAAPLTAPPQPLDQRATPAPAGAPLVTPGPDFTRVAALAVRGVANISSVQVVRRRNSPFDDDPFFQYFFGGRDPFGSREQRALSLGSGVVVSNDGYVVTNSHVVGEDVRRIAEVSIALSDKREIRGRVIGTDPTTDIALLKIEATGLFPLPWGDSSKLQVGEWVLAVGSPFQLSQTVTAGIVSAIGRSNVGFTNYEDFIQTDAAINPGNSGGALVNTRGELVGINTGILSQSGGYQGVGFAVPSILARRVVDDLMKFGEVRRGTISGISIDRMTPPIAEQIGVPASTKGAVVVRVYADSDAADAGFRAGDVIVGFNGQQIDDPAQFFRVVSDSRIGSTGTVRVLRGERTIDLKIPIIAAAATR